MSEVLVDELNSLVADDPRPIDAARWTEVFRRGMSPLFSNLRDVRRYLGVLPATLATIGTEVTLIDVLVLEALRVLQPEVHAVMARTGDALTTIQPPTDGADRVHRSRASSTRSTPASRASGWRCRSFAACSSRPPNSSAGRQALRQGRCSRMGRDGRVANSTVFDFYLARVLDPETVPAADFAQILAVLGDPVAFHEKLVSLSPAALDDVLERLEAYEHDYPLDAIEPAAGVLMRLYPSSRRKRHIFDTGGDLRVDRMLLRLLQRVDDADQLTRIVERLTQSPGCLYGLMQMTLIVSHEPNAGAGLVPKERAAPLVKAMWSTVRHAGATTLERDHNTLRLLHRALLDDPDDRVSLDEQLDENPALTAVLLRDSLDDVESWTPGTIAINRQPTIQWETLLRVFDGPDRLRQRIEALRASADQMLTDPAVEQALTLAEVNLRNAPRRFWVEPAVTSEPASYRPRDLPAPPAEAQPGEQAGEPEPEAVLRAVCLYGVDAERALQADLLESATQQRLIGLLRQSPVIVALDAFCIGHGLPQEDDLSWTMEPRLNVAHTAARARITVPNSPVQFTARSAISEAGLRTPHIVVITDIAVARVGADNGQALAGSVTLPLSLRETRDLLSAALATSASIGRQLLPAIYDDNTLPHTGTELHLEARQGGQLSLADVIDVQPLGTPSNGSPPTEGSYAARGSNRHDTVEARDDLVNRALRYMTGPVWTYPAADQILLDLCSTRSPTPGSQAKRRRLRLARGSHRHEALPVGDRRRGLASLMRAGYARRGKSPTWTNGARRQCRPGVPWVGERAEVPVLRRAERCAARRTA